jgi:hypothetical protein
MVRKRNTALRAVIWLCTMSLCTGGCAQQPQSVAVTDSERQPVGPSPTIFVRVTGPKATKPERIELPRVGEATPGRIPGPVGCDPKRVELVRKAAAAVYAGKAKLAGAASEAELEVHIQYRPYADLNYSPYKPNLDYRLRVIDIKNQVVVLERRLSYEGKAPPDELTEETIREDLEQLVAVSAKRPPLPLDLRPGTDGFFYDSTRRVWDSPSRKHGRGSQGTVVHSHSFERTNHGAPKGRAFLDVLDIDLFLGLSRSVVEAGWDLAPTAETADLIVTGEPEETQTGEYYRAMTQNGPGGPAVERMTRIRVRARGSDKDLLAIDVKGRTHGERISKTPLEVALAAWWEDYARQRVKERFDDLLQQRGK